jgi:hypothetical protein
MKAHKIFFVKRVCRHKRESDCQLFKLIEEAQQHAPFCCRTEGSWGPTSEFEVAKSGMSVSDKPEYG